MGNINSLKDTDSVSVIQSLDDRPILATTSSLKAKFDEYPEEIRVRINNLIDYLKKDDASDDGASNIGMNSPYGATVKAVIEYILGLGSGSVPPDGSLTTAKFASSAYSTDGTMADNSDTKIASQKATKTYADTKIPSSYLDTDGTLTANSDTKVASQKATKTYADTKVAKSTLTTQGDILYNDGNGVARLAKGTARKVLGMDSTGTLQVYLDSLQSLLTASGDIVYASSANTPARLAKGTDGQALILSSGLPSWQTPCKISSGSYLGNAGSGTADRTISIGFDPKFVYIVNNSVLYVYFSAFSEHNTGAYITNSAATTETDNLRRPRCTTGGFIVAGGNSNVHLNYLGITYYYVAIG